VHICTYIYIRCLLLIRRGEVLYFNMSADEFLELQATLDALTKEQENMEAGVIRLHKKQMAIHESNVSDKATLKNNFLKETARMDRKHMPGPGDYSYNTPFGAEAKGGRMNPLPKSKRAARSTKSGEHGARNDRPGETDPCSLERGYRATRKGAVGGSTFGKTSGAKNREATSFGFSGDRKEFEEAISWFFGTSNRSEINKVLLVSKHDAVLDLRDNGSIFAGKERGIARAPPSSVFSVAFYGTHVAIKATRGRHLECKSNRVECQRLGANAHGSEFKLEKVETTERAVDETGESNQKQNKQKKRAQRRFCRLKSEHGLCLTLKEDGMLVCEPKFDETDEFFEGKSTQLFSAEPYILDGNSYNPKDDIIRPKIVKGNVGFGRSLTPKQTPGVENKENARTPDSKGARPTIGNIDKAFDHVEQTAPAAKFGTSSRFGGKKDLGRKLKGEKLLAWLKQGRECNVYLKSPCGKFLRPNQVGSVGFSTKAMQECVVSFCHIHKNEFALRNVHRDYLVHSEADKEIQIRRDKNTNDNEMSFVVHVSGSRIGLQACNGKYISLKSDGGGALGMCDKMSSPNCLFLPAPYAPHYQVRDSAIRPKTQTMKWRTPVKAKPSPGGASTPDGVSAPSVGAPTPGNAGDGIEPMDTEPTPTMQFTPTSTPTPNDKLIRPRVQGGAWAPPTSENEMSSAIKKRKRENIVPGPGFYQSATTKRSAGAVIAPPTIKRTQKEEAALRQHRRRAQKEMSSAGPGMYDLAGGMQAIKQNSSKGFSFSKLSRGITSPGRRKRKKAKDDAESRGESKFSEDYLRNEEIIEDDEEWGDGDISALMAEPDLNLSYVKPRVQGGTWGHKSKKVNWKNYYAMKKARLEKERLKQIGHYDVKHDGVEKKVSGIPLLEKEAKARQRTKTITKKAVENRKMHEAYERAMADTEPGEFLTSQMHDDWAEIAAKKPVFRYHEEAPLPSPAVRARKERELEAAGPSSFLGPQNLSDWTKPKDWDERMKAAEPSRISMSIQSGRDKVKVKTREGAKPKKKVEKFTSSLKYGVESLGPGHYDNVDVQSDRLKAEKSGHTKSYVSFGKRVGRKEQGGVFGERPEVALEAEAEFYTPWVGGDGALELDEEKKLRRPNQKEVKSLPWSMLPTSQSRVKNIDGVDLDDGEPKLILEPNVDWGKKGRDVSKKTTASNYEPFSKQQGRGLTPEAKRGGDDEYDFSAYKATEGDIVDINPRLTPLEKRTKNVKISSRPRWASEHADLLQGDNDEPQLILSPKETTQRQRKDRHVLDLSKQKPRWESDIPDSDLNDFAPSNDALHALYDVERGHEALASEMSKGGVSWDKRKPRFTPKPPRNDDDFSGDSPKLMLSPKEHFKSTMKRTISGVSMSKGKPRFTPKPSRDTEMYGPEDGEGLILKDALEREAFLKKRVKGVGSMRKTKPRWHDEDSNANDDQTALILEPKRTAIEKKPAPTASMSRQRGRDSPLEKNKVDTSHLVYSPKHDFGRRGNAEIASSSKEKHKEPWTKRKQFGGLAAVDNIVREVEELIISPTTAGEKVRKKQASVRSMAKQGPSRSKIDLNGNKIYPKKDKPEPTLSMTETMYDRNGKKIEAKRKPFKDPKDALKRQVKGGGIAPLPKTKRRELPPKVPKKKRIDAGGRLKKMKTITGLVVNKKKKAKKKDLSKTIIGVKKKTKSEIIREQLLSVPTDDGDDDWFLTPKQSLV
jgi:hypothetical protein